ncbi:hypothetical protein LMANV2_130010 [Leptospira interrogans serovar Manilae]|uniref:Uncharacterized protein n=1 Tax=Leptospira interrogans serovar Manilae TaxID=214675 RepID=A0AAQ1SMH3_LEPIR|nr:hypothetical protein LMANV2_130010 [Leptospira interrogans serovar Manilae]
MRERSQLLGRSLFALIHVNVNIVPQFFRNLTRVFLILTKFSTSLQYRFNSAKMFSMIAF